MKLIKAALWLVGSLCMFATAVGAVFGVEPWLFTTVLAFLVLGLKALAQAMKLLLGWRREALK